MDAATKQDIEHLEDKFDDFLEKYDLDMHGDANSDNGGRRGMVAGIRETRRYQKMYPSLLWLLAHKPAKTWATIVSVFVVLSSFMAVGLLNILGAMFGVTLPVP